MHQQEKWWLLQLSEWVKVDVTKKEKRSPKRWRTSAINRSIQFAPYDAFLAVFAIDEWLDNGRQNMSRSKDAAKKYWIWRENDEQKIMAKKKGNKCSKRSVKRVQNCALQQLLFANDRRPVMLHLTISGCGTKIMVRRLWMIFFSKKVFTFITYLCN